MAKDYNTVVAFSNGVASPGNLAINSTGAGTQDGTEIIAEQANNTTWSIGQAPMAYAAGGTNTSLSGSPGIFDGVIDESGASQWLEAMQKGVGAGPGIGQLWWLNDDPSVTGHRVLLLQGQGVLIATYPDLDAAVYVGDGNNATVAAGGGFFYRSSDAPGATPNIAGPYLQLPQSEGYTLRGLDLAAAVDPDGATRFVGEPQAQAFLSHGHDLDCEGSSGTTGVISSGTGSLVAISNGLARIVAPATPITLTAAIVNFGGNETRMANISVRFGITY